MTNRELAALLRASRNYAISPQFKEELREKLLKLFQQKEETNMADLYYCVKCKEKTEIKDAQHVTMKNGKPALKGQCAVCGTNVNALGKKVMLTQEQQDM